MFLNDMLPILLADDAIFFVERLHATLHTVIIEKRLTEVLTAASYIPVVGM